VTTSIRSTDILYFLAEIAVYVAVVWWGFSRDVSTPTRWILGLGLLAVFAVSWGLLAAPRASIALHGAPDVLFRAAWFGLGLAAAVALIAEAV
jgi:hypothetical protein